MRSAGGLLGLLLLGGCVLPPQYQREAAPIPPNVTNTLRNQAVRVVAPHGLQSTTQAFVRAAGGTVVLSGRTPLLLQLEMLPEERSQILPGLRINNQPVIQALARAQATLIRDDGDTQVIVYQGQGQFAFDPNSGGRSRAEQQAAMRALYGMQ